MNEKKLNIGLKLLLIISFIIIMGIGGYFTYSALNQGIMFAYIQNLSIQGLDSNILFDYIILLLIKTLAAFVMYSFIITLIFIVALPLMRCSLLLSYKRNSPMQ